MRHVTRPLKSYRDSDRIRKGRLENMKCRNSESEYQEFPEWSKNYNAICSRVTLETERTVYWIFPLYFNLNESRVSLRCSKFPLFCLFHIFLNQKILSYYIESCIERFHSAKYFSQLKITSRREHTSLGTQQCPDVHMFFS